MTDPDPRALRRGAARTASLIAIPIALAIGAFSLWRFGAFGGAEPRPSTSPTAPGDQPRHDGRPGAAGRRRRGLPDRHRPPARRRPRRQPAARSPPAPSRTPRTATRPDHLACGAPSASVAPTDDVFPLCGRLLRGRARGGRHGLDHGRPRGAGRGHGPRPGRTVRRQSVDRRSSGRDRGRTIPPAALPRRAADRRAPTPLASGSRDRPRSPDAPHDARRRSITGCRAMIAGS